MRWVHNDSRENALGKLGLYRMFPRSFIAASIDRVGAAPSLCTKNDRTIFMIHTSAAKESALETWVANEIADLAGTLPAPKAGLLFLDAQITDLETRCSTRQHRPAHKLGLKRNLTSHQPRHQAKATQNSRAI
jgi:hypothetical protein